jgi:hypothetical protein
MTGSGGNQAAVSGSTVSVTNPLGASTSTFEGAWAELLVPLTLHPAPHLFASFGPSIFHDFAAPQGGGGNGERTQLGAWLEVGGWFGGQATTDRDDLQQLAAAPRFGSKHDFAITNAIVFNGFSTSYAGIKSSDKSFTLEPGLDFFVAEHVSVGLTISATYADDTGIDPTTGGEVSFSQHTYSAAPRIGYDFPLGTHVSLWPQLLAGVGKTTGAESENTSSNPNDALYVWLALTAPVLVHLAPHFFVGFGPSFTQDLSRAYTYQTASVQNRQTNVGASTVIGGAF